MFVAATLDAQSVRTLRCWTENTAAVWSRATAQGGWLCVRHSQPEELLSATNLTRTYEIESKQEATGRYFGYSGFVSGPGFKVFANDFPAGTRLRVTAEIILPIAAE